MPDHVPSVPDPFDGEFLTREQRHEMAEGYRQLANWLETSRFPIPTTARYSGALDFTIASAWFSDEHQDFVRRPGSAARLIGGKVDKGLAYEWDAKSPFMLTRQLGGGVKIRFIIARDAVCEAHEVDKPVEKAIPVDAARAAELEAQRKALDEELDAIEKTTVTVTEKTIEYVCPPSLIEAERKPEAEPTATVAEEIPF